MPISEKLFFACFLVLVGLTSVGFYAIPVEYDYYKSLLSLLWCLFAGYRYFSVVHGNSGKEKIGALPDILTDKVDHPKLHKYIFYHMTRIDVLIWVVLSLLFVLWMSLQGVFPNDIEKINLFRQDMIQIIGQDMLGSYILYETVSAISFYGLFGLIIITALSFGYSRLFRKISIPIIGVGFAAVMALIMVNSSHNAPIFWPVIDEHFGRGLGTSDIMALTAPDFMQDKDTLLIHRFIEGGSIAAYGIILPFLPILFSSLIGCIRLKLSALIGLITLGFLAFIDIASFITPYHGASMILGLSLLGICWGSTRTEKKA